jgi:hypothetical protein
MPPLAEPSVLICYVTGRGWERERRLTNDESTGAETLLQALAVTSALPSRRWRHHQVDMHSDRLR